MGRKKLTFMDTREINELMLADRKHLNEVGFLKLLGCIRFTIFGKIPTFRKKRLNRKEEYGNYPAQYSNTYNNKQYNDNKINNYNQSNRFNSSYGFMGSNYNHNYEQGGSGVGERVFGNRLL